MTVEADADGKITLRGVCPSEDAEELLQRLVALPASQRIVDWRPCQAAHTAILQVLFAAKPTLLGPPVGRFLREHVDPLFQPGSRK